ncbi:MAG: hypothetical protein IJN42_04025 [Clostridia bacterium]|nr:hypothetical protein [Clostridia bacterium]
MFLAASEQAATLLAGLCVGKALTRLPAKFLSRATNLAAGGLLGFQVFCLLPGSIPLISTVILAPALILGIIGGIFLKEGPLSSQTLGGIVLLLHAFCLGLNLAPLPVPLWSYFLCIGLLCSHARLRWGAPIALIGGAWLSAHWTPSLRLGGMVLAISCGLLLQTTPHTRLSATRLVGLVIALLIATF